MSMLLTLPPELQSMIFGCVLLSDISVMIGPAKCAIPGLLRSCHTLRQQYLAMYYRNNIFEFDTVQDDSEIYFNTRICKWLRDIPEEYISMIKHIRLRYNLKVGKEQWVLGFDDCIPDMQCQRRKMTLVRQYPDGSINQISPSSLNREVAMSTSNDLGAKLEVLIVAIILSRLNMCLDRTSTSDKSRLMTIFGYMWLQKFSQYHAQTAPQATEQAAELATEQATKHAADEAAEQADEQADESPGGGLSGDLR